MGSTRVVLVHLRRPVMGNPEEMRTDPFWEFGSFGCTGCHRRNLMHPDRLDEMAGCRLAFAQGGPLGFRLVHLTPPVEVVRGRRANELRWSSVEMPFRYAAAPLLVSNDGASDVPSLKRLIADVDRGTWEARLSSKFRTRRQPLPGLVATELARVYERRRAAASDDEIAQGYEDALPRHPPCVDSNRARTYAGLSGRSRELGTSKGCTRRVGSADLG